ncbi:2-amino-4-hydroxy-6-hydroxymethyldihydropteridine diphosphokinase [Sphingomonas glaciei]|uniref:2-amino-4-hydroxy-6-hydroxymethyldihydropteridine pyrophosphokinase n=1 Tax=Sphingomonas glaciei TaxID=2938948 RepID=A0ABY5MXH8_9SPHN|nr:2-amino-4-hydroxy-6-hydroxymethyldihydropteridine diphosphokinase [Sphingomonas glaciei]UUR08042.1 2-amino-4-hydroxy-6-hydroxymethyldihydropteridine diphosphokinase [Sphingomonas glaciei]
MEQPVHLYAIAIGSNRPHGRFGRPAHVVEAAIAELDRAFTLFDASPLLLNPASGGAGREFANAVAIAESPLDPPAMLAALKAIERAFGRRRGKRWGSRVLDLDILAWDGGRWSDRRLTIPHQSLEQREFMLLPLAAIAPRWRLRGALTTRQLAARLGKRRAKP